MKRVKAFTLVEMLIVLLVISVLLLLIVPNIIKQQNVIQSKGCEAYIAIAEGQIQVYKLDNGNNSLPTIKMLVEKNYLKSETCPDGSKLVVDSDGKVHKA